MMNIESVLSLTRQQTTIYLDKFGIEYATDAEDDELQAILLSIVASYQNIDDLYDLCCVCNQPLDLIDSLVESNGGLIVCPLIEELLSLSDSKPRCTVISVGDTLTEDVIPSKVCRGETIIFADQEPTNCSQEECFNGKLVCNVICDDSTSKRAIYPGLTFGFHNISVYTRMRGDQHAVLESCTKTMFASSPVFSYCMALDAVLDRVCWGWEGVWSSDLEGSLLELLVAVDDDLVALVGTWKRMLSAVYEGGKDMEDMLYIVQEDLKAALCTHSAYAVGRLHQTLSQFLEISSGIAAGIMSIPRTFTSAIHNFIQAKLQTSPHGPLLTEINKLILSAQQYLASCEDITASNDEEINKIKSFLATFERRAKWLGQISLFNCEKYSAKHLWPFDDNLTNAVMEAGETLSPTEVDVIQSLKPSQLSALLQNNSLVTNTARVSYMPVVTLDTVVSPLQLDEFVQKQAETLVMDVVNINNLMGYPLDRSVNLTTTCAVITSLLNAGFSYVVSQSSKLVGLLPCTRSMLLLSSLHLDSNAQSSKPTYTPRLPGVLKKRIRDMPRLFRNKIKKVLSLRLNTDMDQSLAMLRQHHGTDCWVGYELEQVWRRMAATSPPMLMVFELWYGEELIAADFSHPTAGGRSVYVATRFFSRREMYKTMQPGFILALVLCRFLRDRGCCIWDLGGVDLCPLMRYKRDLTGLPFNRVEALRIFRLARDLPPPEGMGTVMSGVLVDNINVSDLLAFT